MRILLVVDCVGGVWTYGLELARELSAARHEVVLAVMGADLAADQRAELDALDVLAWAARPYRLEWMPEADRDLDQAGAWLLQLAKRHEPDIVHLNQFSHAPLRWDAPTVVAAHSDVVTWWRAVHGADPDDAWDAYRQRVTSGLAAADLVIAPTAAYLAQLRSAYGFSTPTAVVHNGRHLQVAAVAGQRQILAAGRIWDEAKNVATAVRAAEGLDWPLVVVGPTGEHPSPASGATFLGRRDGAEVVELMAGAAIFVAPARYEPFGLAPLEAALAGCALVLGDTPTLREVWGPAASYVPPDDEPALRHALRALIDDPDLLAARQQAAAARAATFSRTTMGAAYLAHYQTLQRHNQRVAS